MPLRSDFLAFACLLFAASACVGDQPTAAESETTGTSAPGENTSGTTGEAACIPGYEGCACAPEGACLSGLACYSNLCVDPGGDTSAGGSDDPPASTSSEATTTSGALDTSTGDASTGAASQDSSSSTTAPVPECLDGDNYCADNNFQTCVEGNWEVVTCQEQCALTGYDSPGCAGTDACTCEGFTDEVCSSAAYNLCICADLDYGIPCDQEQWGVFYDECFQMLNDYVECFYDFPIDTPDDCVPAETACL